VCSEVCEREGVPSSYIRLGHAVGGEYSLAQPRAASLGIKCANTHEMGQAVA
jgi:hypothetical protein